jgi:ribosomal protein S18 acetylase RimI-like enzyme
MITLCTAREISYSDMLPPLVWETDPHLFDFLFLRDKALWSRLFRPEWDAPHGLHSANDTTVAVQDAAIVGLLVCFSSDSVESRAEASFRRYHATVDAKTAAHLDWAGAQMNWLFPPAPQNTMLIYNLVVVSQLRGNGIGELLMKEAETCARKAGLSAIHLDTAASSPAVAFYERIGFQRLVETRLCHPQAASVPVHVRMAKQL